MTLETPVVPATVATEGETFVQFRARDRAGNVSAWAPALGDTGTVRIPIEQAMKITADRGFPTR